MKISLLLVLILSMAVTAFAQHDHRMSIQEQLLMPSYLSSRATVGLNSASVNPPPSPVRTIAEWEELQGLTISWTTYTGMLREIVRAAKQECRVYILVNNLTTKTSAINYLAAGGVDTVNVTFVLQDYNSIWSRDYGMWSAYTNDVDTLLTIDWIYNRPRPKDDTAHLALASLLNTPLYQTTSAPWNLIHTGGNFMTDGFGTGFSSNLILNENPTLTAAQIDTIMNRFMGINRYIKMQTLPYDQIHHIDMHIKLIDEETLVVGQYPTGVADGPQIEANLQYILANFNSVYGTPYKVIRIPMPPDGTLYPNNGGDYFTYANASFINKTLIVPTYNIPADSTALRIYREALPGYNVVGINSTASIGALGALHCITKEIATADPLLISHQALHDTYDTTIGYNVNALVQHRSGIAAAYVYYRTDTTQPYQTLSMISLSSQINHWAVQIPPQVAGTTLYYYVQAQAISGKQQVRPMPAPVGYWKFKILQSVGFEELKNHYFDVLPMFPNPSKGITCIPINTFSSTPISIGLYDVAGRKTQVVFDGILPIGERKLFLNTESIASGFYTLKLETDNRIYTQKLIVR